MGSPRLVILSLSAALLAAGVLAGPSVAVTPVDGTYTGPAFGTSHKLQASGTLEGGFSISAAETWMVFGCPVSAGTVINSYTPKGGGKYDVTYLMVSATTTQGEEGVKCEYSRVGPETVTITRSREGNFTVSGCSGSSCGFFDREGPAPRPPAKPPEDKLVVALLEMPDRYGVDADGDGLIDQMSRPAEVNPKTWTARLLVGRRPGRTCDADATYSFEVEGDPARFDRDPENACVFTYTEFKKLGGHEVKVVAKKDGDRTGRGTSRVVLRDLLIVGLGDSNGSGEGNPDIPGFGLSWIDPRCDRSRWSYQAQTAAALEDASQRTSVTFVHLACSGASITEGLIGSYDGINPVEGEPPLLPQVTQLRNLIAARRPKVPARDVDALILSVGVNDLGFGKIVSQCIYKAVCQDSTGLPGSKRGETVDQALARWLDALPRRYNRLANAMATLRIPPERIYITQYFDSLRNDKEDICDPLIGYALTPQFTYQEAEWAYSHFLVPLNKAVAAAATRKGWTRVRPPADFRKHGYCAEDSWIVRLTDSFMDQRDASGAMHSTIRGHEAQRDRVFAALKRDKIDGTP